MTSLQLQAGARRPRLLRSSTTLDRHARRASNPPLPTPPIPQTSRAPRIVRLAARVERRASRGIRERRRYIDERIRAGHRRPRSQCPLRSLVGCRGGSRAVLWESETAGVGGCGKQGARAAGACRAAGDVIGCVARAA